MKELKISQLAPGIRYLQTLALNCSKAVYYFISTLLAIFYTMSI